MILLKDVFRIVVQYVKLNQLFSLFELCGVRAFDMAFKYDMSEEEREEREERMWVKLLCEFKGMIITGADLRWSIGIEQLLKIVRLRCAIRNTNDVNRLMRIDLENVREFAVTVISKGVWDMKLLRRFRRLKSLDMTYWYWKNDAFDIKLCRKLRRLRLMNLDVVNELDGLDGLRYLKNLELVNCSGFKNLRCEGMRKFVYRGNLYVCDLNVLRMCKELRCVRVNEIVEHNLDALEGCRDLRIVEIKSCPKLMNIDGLRGCTRLKEIDVSGSLVRDLDALRECKDLRKVKLEKCVKLENIDGLRECVKLRELGISGSLVQNLDALGKCVNLEKLVCVGCSQLIQIRGLEGCVKLKEVDFTNCSVVDVTPLVGCKGLEYIGLKMRKIFGTEGLV